MQAQSNPKPDSFAALLEESLSADGSFEGKVVSGRIVAITKDAVVIDVGLKSEGRVALKEFSPAQALELKKDDYVKVYIERFEDRNGEAVLSVSRARREEAWEELEECCEKGLVVDGVIFGKIKGGYAVQVKGDIVAFLPGSQVDIRPIRDVSPLMNISQPLKILKMDKQRNNIVVSRRSVLEESRAEARHELLENLVEGQELTGMVKNITDYGAFIDLGGFDGLLHVTDISWKRISHPSEALKVGDNVRVKVIRYNAETQRISLGMKQLEADPWQNIESKYPLNSRHVGTITNITDYGAFIELEPAVEGLIYVTEMSWTKKNVHPSKLLTKDQKVDVIVLDIDMSKRRISLGMKQCLDNPWKTFMDKNPIGSIVSGEIKNITEFGLFVGVSDDLDGMVHMSDVSWQDSEDAVKSFQKGQTIEVKVLDIDPEKERISLGIKQLAQDPFESMGSSVNKGETVTCTVTGSNDKGVEVTLSSGLPGFIKKSDLSRDRSYQKTDRFAQGEKIDAQVLGLDRLTRRVNLSVKALEIAEEKAVMSEYGSQDSGASLGDIFKNALDVDALKQKASKE